ncbi:hypothetical protein [Bacillus sp. MRMR6]|uniref:hypothetical protein n=1 Tax=Bacillus sp. MRMR6 TaxID=1928617 RepID=UPI000951FB08|nr:hypothetical protein [Bacillus sp. MRMR6]OLS33343.1 hypothetical protein BTR25_26465 [Bacillus sp. MRMR6]
MGKVHSPEELMNYISNMNRDNSVVQFSIPGKGKFTLVLQEEDDQTIKADVEANPELQRMILEAQEQYKKGLEMPTSDFLKSFSAKDFI